MIAGLERIAQVKLPVTDLVRSIRWYADLLDLRLFTEFVEDGVLRGAGLIDRAGRFTIALRDRSACRHAPRRARSDQVGWSGCRSSVRGVPIWPFRLSDVALDR